MSDYTRTDAIQIVASTLATTEKKAGLILNGLVVDAGFYVTKQEFTAFEIDSVLIALRWVVADESKWVKDYKGLKTINLDNYYL